jgi:uncharacterized linocin/CFP29 family protein
MDKDLIVAGKDGQARFLGPVAQRLLACDMNANALRTNDVLMKDEWKELDSVAIKSAQERLVGVADLKSRGLVYDLGGDGLGTTVLEYQDMSDIGDAQVSMVAAAKGVSDVPDFNLKYLPLPITHYDFYLNARHLAASRKKGMPLDTTMVEMAGQKIADKIETWLFQGSSAFTFGGGTVRGYATHANRNTGSLTGNWDDSSTSGEVILNDVRAMKQALLDDKFYGPYVLYVPGNFETRLDDDYVSNYPKTIRERLLGIAGIEAIRVADKLADDNVLLVQMTADVVRMVTGLPLTVVEWQTQGDMLFHYKLITIDVPQIRARQNGECGVAHWS